MQWEEVMAFSVRLPAPSAYWQYVGTCQNQSDGLFYQYTTSVSIFYSVIACSGLGGSSAHMAFARITRLDHKLDTFMEINQMIVDDSCWIQRLDIGRISAVYNISLETLAVAPRS